MSYKLNPLVYKRLNLFRLAPAEATIAFRISTDMTSDADRLV
jgi:hypothetical protein